VAEPEPIEMKPEKAPREKPKAEDLLAEANAARKAKEWKRAEGIYGEVVEEFRGTAAAQVALVASATLRLEHLGDPRGAAKRFRQALAGKASGPLAEEARYGLAEAYRAIGDDAAEAEALTQFLRHHGDSPLADRARKRRMQLP
jgi:outer membrane protein assembly factor BamD (BamD/ComL family)